MAKIVNFETEVTKLAARYGAETIEEARMALRINEYKLAKSCENKLLQELENTCANIQKIRTKPHRHNFIYDVDHGFKATECSVMEGLTACAVEDQGFVKQLQRATKKGVDFVDELGREWDVKTGYSFRLGAKSYSFNVKELSSQVEKSLGLSKNIIIDMTDLIEKDLHCLNNEINMILSRVNNNTKIMYINRNDHLASRFIR